MNLSVTDLDSISDTIKAFNPSRLQLAREAAGLESKALAAMVGTTASAISQLEHGDTRPRIETLLRLSFALGVPTRFFAAPAPVPLPFDTCHFRRLRGAPKGEQRAVVARGRLVHEVLEYLSEIVQFPADGVTPVQRPAVTIEEAEELAQNVRDAWKLGRGPIPDMVGLLEVHGVIPVEVAGHSDKLDAFSAWVGSWPMVFLSIDKGSGSRRRFDAAHELAHLIAHRGCPPGDAELENVANRFASAFLLPAEPFIAECPQRLFWPALRALKLRWGVSLQAIVRRARDLGIFSEATYRRAHVQIGQFGWRQVEPDEPPMEHPSLIRTAVEQIRMHGRSVDNIAADLPLGERLFREVVWPASQSA
ncbi:MAG: XRE family transcriptional regulator [Gemmatimonadota bacterium]